MKAIKYHDLSDEHGRTLTVKESTTSCHRVAFLIHKADGEALGGIHLDSEQIDYLVRQLNCTLVTSGPRKFEEVC